jgi:hypothetical protein
MKAKLQYCEIPDGAYQDCGTLRDQKKRDYKITPVKGNNRIDEPEIIGYKVQVNTLNLELDSAFLDQEQWYFRLYFPNIDKEIKLGLHPYLLDFNGLINRGSITADQIKLEFYITKDEYKAYSVPNLPEN